MTMSALELVQAQFDAYNARDLDRFMACFARDIRAIRLPEMVVTLDGRDAYAAFYATQRFCHEGLRAKLVNRIVVGNTVIDHELIYGLAPEPLETAVMFVVREGLIATAFAIPGK